MSTPSLSGQSNRNTVVPLSVMMFLQFFVWGAWYVSMTGFMGAKGMSGLIWWAYTVGPIAAIVSPFFLGLVADRYLPTQRVLGGLHLLGGVLLCLAPSVAKAYEPAKDGIGLFQPFMLVLLLHMLCYMPTLGLTGSISFHNLTDREKQFPLVRVWGTIGWIVGNLVVGGNLKTFGLDVSWIADGDKSPIQFYVAGGAAILLAAYSFVALPHTPPPAAGKSVTVREILGLDSLALFVKPSYAVFMLCSFLLCIPLAGYYAFARTYAGTTGFTNPTLTMSFGQMSEILFMIVMPLCFARLGVKWMLAIGMLAWVVRYGLFAGAWDSSGGMHHVTWMVLGGILLHGICYDFFFVTGMIYVDQSANKEIRSQAQGFLVLATQGLGMLIGAWAFGQLFAAKTPPEAAALFKQASEATVPADAQRLSDQANQLVQWNGLWMMPAAFALVILVVFVLLFKPPAKPRTE
jgi:nucleoside transporter